MNILKIFLAFLFFALPSMVWADEDNPWYFEGTWTHYGSEDFSEMESLNGKELFILTPAIESGFSAYTFMYHDESLYNYFVGGAYGVETKIAGYLQFGLGVGKTHFDDYDDFFTVNPWVYWEYGRLTANLHLEYIPDESDSLEWFWRGDVRYDFGKESGWFTGAYGERWLGYGPTLGYAYKWFTIRATYLFDTDPGRERMLGAMSFASQ